MTPIVRKPVWFPVAEHIIEDIRLLSEVFEDLLCFVIPQPYPTHDPADVSPHEGFPNFENDLSCPKLLSDIDWNSYNKYCDY